MPDFTYSILIEAPPARVWAVLLDVERWPEWTSTVTAVRRLDAGPLAIGSRTRIEQPQLMPATWTVTELDGDNHNFVWTTGRFGVRIDGLHTVTAKNSGARVTLALNYSGLFGALMGRSVKDINWDHLTAEAQGLKARCESAGVGPSAIPG